MDRLVKKVALRFVAENRRKDVRELTHPINRPKGVDPSVVREQGKQDLSLEESIAPKRTDIQPADVFPGNPKWVAVQSLVTKPKGMEKAIEKQIPKDKGYDAVSNLSQYLIETAGGGGAKPVGT